MVLKQAHFDVISGLVPKNRPGSRRPATPLPISVRGTLIRLCDIHGDVIEDILLLLDIDPVRISRSFDITLGGIPSTRKIEVANPYSEERTFYLHTRKIFQKSF